MRSQLMITQTNSGHTSGGACWPIKGREWVSPTNGDAEAFVGAPDDGHAGGLRRFRHFALSSIRPDDPFN